MMYMYIRYISEAFLCQQNINVMCSYHASVHLTKVELKFCSLHFEHACFEYQFYYTTVHLRHRLLHFAILLFFLQFNFNLEIKSALCFDFMINN